MKFVQVAGRDSFILLKKLRFDAKRKRFERSEVCIDLLAMSPNKQSLPSHPLSRTMTG